MKTSKAAAKRTSKSLQAKLGEVRLAWEKRGVAAGELDQVKAWEDQVWALENGAGLLVVPVVDSLFR